MACLDASAGTCVLLSQNKQDRSCCLGKSPRKLTKKYGDLSARLVAILLSDITFQVRLGRPGVSSSYLSL